MGNAVSKDIVQMLSGESSIGLTEGTDLFYGRMPIAPQNCAVVYDNAGPPPLLQYVKSRSTYEYAAISIRARHATYDGAYAIMESIRLYLHGLSGVTVDGSDYMLIEAVNAVGVIHYDENDRPVLFQNFSIQRKPS
jgi:hypothetical protein